MIALRKCVLNSEHEIKHQIQEPEVHGVVELTTYFTDDLEIPSTFEEYLDIHEKALSLWDADTKRYRNGRFVSKSKQYCMVYLSDLGVYVMWRKSPSFASNTVVLVGKPFCRDKIWQIQCFRPDESTLRGIKSKWDKELERFRNSVFLKKDGDRVWVYLKDLKICVGWVKGQGQQIFGEDRYNGNNNRPKLYETQSNSRDTILELRRKINNCYGCWH